MAIEMRLSHFVLVAIPVLLLGCVGLVCVGAFNIPAFEVAGFKFGGLNKKDIEDAADNTAFTTSGYKLAKTPVEAMDGFHKAIQARQYTYAARFTTKEYGEQLRRAHKAAAPLGKYADSIRAFAADKGLTQDRLTYSMNKFDPFPTNFKVGPAPVTTKDVTIGTFIWEPLKFDARDPNTIGASDVFKQFDAQMFKNVLLQPIAAMTFGGVTKIDLVKEGEDWKLNIPSNPMFETNVTYFMSKAKAYDTALNGFVQDMNRHRNVTKEMFENEVYILLKESK